MGHISVSILHIYVRHQSAPSMTFCDFLQKYKLVSGASNDLGGLALIQMGLESWITLYDTGPNLSRCDQTHRPASISTPELLVCPG